MKIHVCGDFLEDVNLFRTADPSTYQHAESVGNLVEQRTPGGAWYLADMIRLCVPDDVSVTTAARGRLPVSLPRATQLWRQFREPDAPKGQQNVWRVEELMGCTQLGEGTKIRWDGSDAPPDRGDLLVIDDLNIGGRDVPERIQPHLWDSLRGDDPPFRDIVVKASAAPDCGSPLWRELLRSECAERLTLVVSADALRERGSTLSRFLSWERTVEDLDRDLFAGASASDLALFRRVVVLFGVEGVGVYERGQGGDGLRFRRFLFDPALGEGTWRTKHQGTVFGRMSILTASLVGHIIEPLSFPLCIALSRAVAAMRENHRIAYGHGDVPDAKPALEVIGRILRPADVRAKGYEEPINRFAFAYPPVEEGYGFRSLGDIAPPRAPHLDILHDVAGADYEELLSKGVDVVQRGAEKALPGVPRAEYGDYVTMDRDEIERINTVRSLMANYTVNEKEKRPLSIAVFGAPGAGKSFAVKELLKEIEPDAKRRVCITFNLSEFADEEDLVDALHQVRTGSVKGVVPLVFWDEFDCSRGSEPLAWLRFFLSPMQDGEFSSNGQTYPLGRAVFVFAGGTRETAGDFIEAADAHRDKKAPDFVSRLRGSLDIKGVNPLGLVADPASIEARRLGDPAHVIRRAIILRSLLGRYWPRLRAPNAVSAAVIAAFLRAEFYRHGARSMEYIVSLCDLSNASRFEVASLPSESILGLHVSSDFMSHVGPHQINRDMVEKLAELQHEDWRRAKEEALHKEGRDPTGEQKSQTSLRPYSELSDKQKDENREVACRIAGKLAGLGYGIVRGEVNVPGAIAALTPEQIGELAAIEHTNWLRRKLNQGFEPCPKDKRSDALCLHHCVATMDKLLSEDKKHDLRLAERLIPNLRKAGFSVVPLPACPRRPFSLTVRAVVTNEEGQWLLVRRSSFNRSYVGCWEWPGGKVDPGEDFAVALRREMLEEIGLQIQLTGLIGSTQFDLRSVRVVALCMAAREVGGRIRLSHEHDDHAWVPPGELGQFKVPDTMRDFMLACAHDAIADEQV